MVKLIPLNTNSSNLTNLCPRCNKPRVNGKTWKEEVATFSGISVVTHTQTICSDANCQKIVEEKWAIELAKSNKIKEDFDKRAADKKLARAQIKLGKKK